MEEREKISGQLRKIIDAMADPVVVITSDYRVELVNRCARELFARAAESGMLCHQLSHRSAVPCGGSGHPCPMRAARETGAAVKVLHEHYDEGGQAHFVEITASPLVSDGGVFMGIVESQRDVTARVSAERALAGYATRLEDSNRLKDLFIDIMRHDLMSPVTVILATSLCALRGELAPALTEDLQAIAKQTRKIIDMIQNASVLAQLESGKALPFGEADLQALAEAVIRDQDGAAAERGMRIVLHGTRPARARVNPLVADALANLISNAVKYGTEGTPIDVSVQPVNSGWRISVADRGPGVPESDKQAIFTRYTRRAKQGVRGTGLGLSIVRGIVEAHGGRVWVEDNPGGGSVFVVELPQRLG